MMRIIMHGLKMRISQAADQATLFELANDFLACFRDDDFDFLGAEHPSRRIACAADVERWLGRLTDLYHENKGARSMPHRLLLSFFCELKGRVEQLARSTARA